MGDSTYTETFGENDAADGEDSAQTEEKIIQENSVDAAQEGETVVQNEPGSDTSGDDANSEPVTLDWKKTARDCRRLWFVRQPRMYSHSASNP